MSILNHIEKYVGTIDQGWQDDDSEESIKIISMNESPVDSTRTYVTLGLSNHILNISDSKRVRLELLLSVYKTVEPTLMVSFLMSLYESFLHSHSGVLRGEVIHLEKKLATKMGFEAAYCTIPVLYDDDFSVYELTSPPTVMVWIIPIFQSEEDYIKLNGWEKFEDILEDIDPNLFSIERRPVI